MDGSSRVSTYHATMAAKPELMSHWYCSIVPTPLCVGVFGREKGGRCRPPSNRAHYPCVLCLRRMAYGCPGAAYAALGLPQDCGILFLGVETLRFIVVPLVVLALSLPVQAFDPLLFVAHSLHETNHRQTYHFAERSVWWHGGPAHFVQVDPHEDYIRDYHMFWHAALDVM